MPKINNLSVPVDEKRGSDASKVLRGAESALRSLDRLLLPGTWVQFSI